MVLTKMKNLPTAQFLHLTLTKQISANFCLTDNANKMLKTKLLRVRFNLLKGYIGTIL